jgi:lysozyme
MKVNTAAINLIKQFEGLRLKAYLCPAKIWTIGYGHTAMAGPPAPKSGMTITEAEASAILVQDVSKFAQGVAAMIKVPVTENQFGAVVSMAFNVGLGAMGKSTLMRKLNAKDYAGAANEFMKWTKASGKVLPGLVRRRQAERTLFLTR